MGCFTGPYQPTNLSKSSEAVRSKSPRPAVAISSSCHRHYCLSSCYSCAIQPSSISTNSGLIFTKSYGITPMQSLLLPAPWFSKTHFGPHRFDIDPGRVSVHLRPPSSTGPKASLRTSYSALPMSGIVPTGTQAPQSADTNTATTQREQQGGERAEISSSADQTRSNLPPRLPTLIPVEGTGVVSTQPPRFLSTEELLVNPTTQVPSISSTVSLSQVISGSPQLGLHGVPTSGAIRALPPRSTRRAKAHVASACVNCKRKHLGCDSARPCRRCVLSGKAVCCAMRRG